MSVKRGVLASVYTVLLTVLCISSAFAGGAGESAAGSGVDYTTYLNLDSGRPIIQDGMGEDIVLSVAVNQPANGGPWDQLWIGRYYEEFLNLNFDVEQIPVSALSERKNLMFAANNVPDILLHMDLTPDEIARYGQREGQLLALDDHINETLTPNISEMFDERPTALALSTTPDGHIYTLPSLSDGDAPGAVPRLFVNTRWLDAVGMEMPRTLDQFIEMARAFKQEDPGNVGSENVIPIGGSFTAYDLSYYFLNALGYVGGPRPLSSGFVRDGEVDIPAGNPVLFREFLGIMNTLYEEGLIAKDYFLIDRTEVFAQMTSGRLGVLGQAVYVTGIPDWADWEAPYPLTSQWNDTPVWEAPPAVGVGGFAAAADTAYPEVALRFADTYFDIDSRILWIGPVDGSEEAMGYLGMTPEVDGTIFDESRFPDGISDLWSYLMGYIGPQPQFGNVDVRRNVVHYERERKGYPVQMERIFDPTNPDANYRITVVTNLIPYITPGFPSVYYLDEETSIRLADLTAVIKPFVDEQLALFVTGTRPLSEFDEYIEELYAIGFQEYFDIHEDIWDNYLSVLRIEFENS